MAENGGSPALVSIGLSIPETITAIDKIVERREVRKAAQEKNFFADIRDDLDVVDAAIQALDNTFADLVNAFSNEDIIEDPVQLKELVGLTESYMRTYKVVPRFERSIGTIRSLAGDP